ncbi:glucokinase [Bergeyella sp. RCAD1439]|uniref:glucokinase n=1 Tax=Bergeyella anatis TaxID=3113737 RepID=UPI002E16C715|nr:glucokinase [Bergeyella sp. RCAD1439]
MASEINFPLYSPGIDCEINRNSLLVAADLRYEKSVLAVYSCLGGKLSETAVSEYVTTEFSDFRAMLKHFLSEQQITTEVKVAVAVPGPVISGSCHTPNLPWPVDKQKIQSELGISKVSVINDLEAVAYSLACAKSQQIEMLYGAEAAVPRGNVAILAPGNGLGEAGLFFDGQFLRPFATEGGHTEFSPRNDDEVEFYRYLHEIYGLVTWESVLSKKGLYNIYRFLRDIGRHEEGESLSRRVQNEPFLEVLASEARAGQSRLVNLTVELFWAFLAREANSMVLKLKATGGLIITGEIIEVLLPFCNREKFYRDFMISDRMERLLKGIPIYVMRNEKEILEGAAYYGAFYEKGERTSEK